MSTQSLTKRQSPEDLELEAKRSELSALSDRLAESELQFAELKLSLASFQRRYFHEVGSKYIELDDLRAQIAETLAKKKPDEVEAEVKAKEARQQAEASSREYESFAKDSQKEADYEPPSDECKKLYRRIASIIHPDKALDDAKRELGTRLMKDLNDAYAKRDMKRMERILAEWEESPDAVSGEGTGAELIWAITSAFYCKKQNTKG